VVSVGQGNPGIWYTDREGMALAVLALLLMFEGNTDEEYISLFADNEAIFGGRTPIQACPSCFGLGLVDVVDCFPCL
jgi:hypothetical protein